MSTGSVSPKERVNIRYKAATGDQKQEVELPFKQLVIGEFSTQTDATPLEERERLVVDKDSFESVLKSFDLSISLNVPNRLSDESGIELPVNFSVRELKDFEPQAIIDSVPELKKLYQLRQALMSLKAPLGNVPQFRKALESILDDEEQRAALMGELAFDSADDVIPGDGIEGNRQD